MHGRGDYYGIPVELMQKLFVLAQEFDVMLGPVIDERRPELSSLEATMFQGDRFSTLRVPVQLIRRAEPEVLIQEVATQLSLLLEQGLAEVFFEIIKDEASKLYSGKDGQGVRITWDSDDHFKSRDAPPWKDKYGGARIWSDKDEE